MENGCPLRSLAPAGFLDDERTGRHVSGMEFQFPKAIKSPNAAEPALRNPRACRVKRAKWSRLFCRFSEAIAGVRDARLVVESCVRGRTNFVRSNNLKELVPYLPSFQDRLFDSPAPFGAKGFQLFAGPPFSMDVKNCPTVSRDPNPDALCLV